MDWAEFAAIWSVLDRWAQGLGGELTEAALEQNARLLARYRELYLQRLQPAVPQANGRPKAQPTTNP